MTATTCRVEAYARAVGVGEIVAGRLVRLACARHLRDLENGGERGLRFDETDASRAIRLIEAMNLPEGDARFQLLPWQAFIVGSLFGWKGADGARRFRTAYIESGKGSGKSPLVSAIGLLGLLFDGEAAAEIYSAAVTREQASIMFRDAKNIVDATPALRSRLEVGQANIAHHASASFFRPVSSEHRGLDGKRPHMGLIDEIHEHPTAMVVNKMRAGTKRRRQALIVEITNSGHDKTTICWQHHEYSEKVLTSVLDDDAWFAYVCGLDVCEKCVAEGHPQPVDGCPECDDWRDEKVWLKANPSLPVIPGLKYLREQVREAVGMPANENIVKRLNFCCWTEQADRVIPMNQWDACRKAVDHEWLKGRPCFVGLDIGATSDFTAAVAVFPHDDPEQVTLTPNPETPDDRVTITRRSFTALARFWLPEIPVKRDTRMQETIRLWKRQGLVTETPGNTVDYDQVMADLVQWVQPWSMVEIAFDRGFQGTQMGTNLMKVYGEQKVIQFPQGILSMSPPFRELLELIKQRRFHHDGNPALRWMAANVAAEERGGLVKPSKERSLEKIDGITALVMAMGRAILRADEMGPSEADILAMLGAAK